MKQDQPIKPKYTIEQLLAQCDFSQPMSAEDREWLDAPSVGREIWDDYEPQIES